MTDFLLISTLSFSFIISDFSKSLDLVDIWREMNPDKIQLTWSNNTGQTQSSRLDFWLITSNLVQMSSNCDIYASLLTDHCVTISTSVNFSQPRVIQWKFNSDLLKSISFCNKIRGLISEIKQHDDLTPLNKWEWLKYNIRKISAQEGIKKWLF